jgi:hypothetical protein
MTEFNKYSILRLGLRLDFDHMPCSTLLHFTTDPLITISVVRILRCQGWPPEDALHLIRQTNSVTLLETQEISREEIAANLNVIRNPSLCIHSNLAYDPSHFLIGATT